MNPDPNMENPTGAMRSGRTGQAIFLAIVMTVTAALIWVLRDTYHDDHRGIAAAIMNGNAEWPPNFLYYALVGGLGRLISAGDDLLVPAMALLAVAVGAKALLTLRFFAEIAPTVSARAAMVSVFLLLFIFPVPVAYLLDLTIHYHKGGFPPNVWHNSTTMALMPFALAAFLLQVHSFEGDISGRVFALTALIVIGILIKPSFFFAYGPATALWLVFFRAPFSARMLAALPIVAGGALTLLLYLGIYKLQQGNLYEDPSSLALRPFRAWSLMTTPDTFFMNFVASFAAPLLFMALALRPERPLWFAYALTLNVVAVAIFVLLSETGPRDWHGNFLWQAIVCSFILHAVIAADIHQKWVTRTARWRVAFIAFVYAMMTVSGVFYLARLILFGVKLPY